MRAGRRQVAAERARPHAGGDLRQELHLRPSPGPSPSPSPSPALTRIPISGCKAPWLRASRSSFAIGALLATWHAIGGGAGSYNPAVTLARFVKKDRAYSLCSSAVKTPALEILVQVMGAFLAAIASAWAMDADGFHTPATDAADLRGHLKPAVLDCLATAALASSRRHRRATCRGKV